MRVLQRAAGGDFIEDRLEAALAQARLSSVDRHLCQELTYGIVRWQAALDWLIARKTEARQQKPVLRNLLRMGLYQISGLIASPAMPQSTRPSSLPVIAAIIRRRDL